jgi:hypothetical protein
MKTAARARKTQTIKNKEGKTIEKVEDRRQYQVRPS